MKLKMTKELTSNCTVAAEVDLECSPATSDVGILTPASEEPVALSSVPDDGTDIPRHAELVMIPAEDGFTTAAHIYEVAWKTLSSETTCTGPHIVPSAKLLHSSQLKPAEYKQSSDGIPAMKMQFVGAVVVSQHSSDCCVSLPHYSPNGVHTPADASYYLWQEFGDVIIESSDEDDKHLSLIHI